MTIKISEEVFNALSEIGFTAEMEEKLQQPFSNKGIGTSQSINVSDEFTLTGIVAKSSFIDGQQRDWWAFTTEEGMDVSFRALFSTKDATALSYWQELGATVDDTVTDWSTVYQPKHRIPYQFITSLEVKELVGKTFRCVAKGDKPATNGNFVTTMYAFVQVK